MKRDDLRDAYTIASVIARATDHPASTIAANLIALRAAGRRLNTLDTARLNRPLTPAEDKAISRLEKRAADLARVIGCATERTDDPRAGFGFLLLLPDGRTTNSAGGYGWVL